jgi:hypothetical protein
VVTTAPKGDFLHRFTAFRVAETRPVFRNLSISESRKWAKLAGVAEATLQAGNEFKNETRRVFSSAVAAFCWNASFSSRVSRATFVSSRAVDEMRGRRAFSATRLLRGCAFVGSLPALERRLTASSPVRDRAFFDGY